MWNVITAIGDKKLNNELRSIDKIIIKNSDIQYQEGILEVLDKYKNVDILILSDMIIGNMEVQELLRKVKMLQGKIEIILVTSAEIEFEKEKNIDCLVDYNKDYVELVKSYILDKDNINLKEENIDEEKTFTQIMISEKISKMTEEVLDKSEVRYTKAKEKSNKKVITVIGNAGVR